MNKVKIAYVLRGDVEREIKNRYDPKIVRLRTES